MNITSRGWDGNASLRHKQLIEGNDITFWKLLLPELQRLLSYFPDHRTFKVLDVGCGTAVLTEILSDHVTKVVGIDPSQESITIGRNRTRGNDKITLICDTIDGYATNADAQYDLVISHMVLHTVEHLGQALTSVSRVITNKGALIFSIPHPCFWDLVKQLPNQDEIDYCKSSQHEIPFTIHREKSALPSLIPYIHRPLEEYFLALYQAGFVVELLSEPFPCGELAAEYSRPWKYPGFLFFTCRKN